MWKWNLAFSPLVFTKGQNEAGIICFVFTEVWLPSYVELTMLQVAGISCL